MRKVIALAWFAACSSNNNATPIDSGNLASVDAAKQLDAQGSGSGSGSGSSTGSGDFACVGDAAPTVPATVAVKGAAGTFQTDLASIIGMMFTAPYTGAIKVCAGEPCTDANLLGNGSADATGNYSFTVTTNSAPVAGYVEIPGAGSGSAATLETLSYIGTPYVKATTTVPYTVVTPQAAAGLAANIGATCTTGAGFGFVTYKAVDCGGNVLTDSGNVHGVLTQNGTAVGDPPIDIYQSISTALTSANLTQYIAQAAPLKGIFLVCGVPPGQTKVAVTYSSTALLPVTALSLDGGVTEVVAQPGY